MLEISQDLFIESDIPGLYFKKMNAMILSDVHIGYEEEMAKKGIFLPKVQKKKFIDIYNKSLKIFKFDKIIIDGDLKHMFNSLGKEERSDLNDIFNILKNDNIKVIVIKGNHDNYISLVTEKFDNVELVDNLDLGNIYIYHGHKDVKLRDNTTYIIGHEHPRISIKDKLGFSRKLQCFLNIPLKNSSNVIVLPSIGTYQSGNDVSLLHNNYMSPIIRNFGILEKAKPYVIIEKEGIMEFPELGLLKNILF